MKHIHFGWYNKLFNASHALFVLEKTQFYRNINISSLILFQ